MLSPVWVEEILSNVFSFLFLFVVQKSQSKFAFAQVDGGWIGSLGDRMRLPCSRSVHQCTPLQAVDQLHQLELYFDLSLTFFVENTFFGG